MVGGRTASPDGHLYAAFLELLVTQGQTRRHCRSDDPLVPTVATLAPGLVKTSVHLSSHTGTGTAAPLFQLQTSQLFLITYLDDQRGGVIYLIYD